ncbi:fe2+ zn2+ uptake regulation protein [Pseudomonas sp. SWRI99]|uniref:fe2+ zn2+ uptake regulation protein n=1 Tax=Pseudomonas sp. SWRI99 TaxID=2745506 RepID=UPI0016462D42|nr:fe2+ zn2+ uptake regulation protein [Pseudomonas sp. SWRI99]MBC3776656.1 fe2+ zn2+ uptake regulation protein [Pseudomonas sp. SWRI99]
MLNNPGAAALIVRPAAPRLPSEFDRSANQHIRELLRHFGLRSSLIRFKVLNALVLASRDGHPTGANGVHTWVASSSPQLSFISVREVLKRLCLEGLIVLENDKTYRFTRQARAILQQHNHPL